MLLLQEKKGTTLPNALRKERAKEKEKEKEVKEGRKEKARERAQPPSISHALSVGATTTRHSVLKVEAKAHPSERCAP